ncbi:hypothetical protein ABIE69_002264 [Rhodobacteraceae bacterium MBR-64]|jgi:hypothetical protein
MTRKSTRLPASRHSTSPAPEGAPQLPAMVPPQAAPVCPADPAPHPHAALDRSAMASLARFTGGLSPHAMIDAWSDWAMHLGRAPGRQLELMERAQVNAMKLAQYTSAQMLGQPSEKPFKPGPYDTRWSHQGWDKAQGYRIWILDTHGRERTRNETCFLIAFAGCESRFSRAARRVSSKCDSLGTRRHSHWARCWPARRVPWSIATS